MTAEEHVKAIYPTAKAMWFPMGGMTLWRIQIEHIDGFAYWETTLAEGYTREQVWERGWKIIQQEMLNRLAD